MTHGTGRWNQTACDVTISWLCAEGWASDCRDTGPSLRSYAEPY